MPADVYGHMLKVDDIEHDIMISENNKSNSNAASIEILKQIQDIVTEDEIKLNLFEEGLPKEIDLTKSNFMPDVGNQGTEGICAAFSSIYYQYSYEVNRKNKIKSKQDRIVFSPHFEYSYKWLDKNYKQIQERGCLTDLEWKAEYGAQVEPQTGVLYNSNNIAGMRNALGMRINHYYEYLEPHTDKDLGSAETKLRVAKTLLAMKWCWYHGMQPVQCIGLKMIKLYVVLEPVGKMDMQSLL